MRELLRLLLQPLLLRLPVAENVLVGLSHDAQTISTDAAHGSAQYGHSPPNGQRFAHPRRCHPVEMVDQSSASWNRIELGSERSTQQRLHLVHRSRTCTERVSSTISK
jgi:hypothetical protein